jgi:hypothetical protein
MGLDALNDRDSLDRLAGLRVVNISNCFNLWMTCDVVLGLLSIYSRVAEYRYTGIRWVVLYQWHNIALRVLHLTE